MSLKHIDPYYIGRKTNKLEIEYFFPDVNNDVN